MTSRFDCFVGCIAASGFARGDNVVVGAWRSSPLGSFVDVMWIQPDGTRTLLAPNASVAAYVSDLYTFDRVQVTSVRGGFDGAAMAVEAGPLRLRLEGGERDWRSWLFAARPRALRRWPPWIALEDLLGRPFVGWLIGGAQGVRAAGRAPGGQREWYGIEDYRCVTRASMTVEGADCGPLAPLRPDLGVGLSAFPSVPAMVHVGTIIAPRAV